MDDDGGEATTRRVRRRVRQDVQPAAETSAAENSGNMQEQSGAVREGEGGAGAERSEATEGRGSPSAASFEWDGGGFAFEAQTSADWTSLPENALARVFSFLEFKQLVKASCVCSSWRAMAASPSLWETLDLRSHALDKSAVKGLSARFSPLIRSLLFRSSSVSSTAFLRVTHLTSLFADMCFDLTDSYLGMLVGRLGSNLRSLTLSDASLLTSSSISTIATCCPLLTELSLSGLQSIERFALQSLALECPSLASLSLLDCALVDEKGLSSLKQIRYLSLSGSKLNWATSAFHIFKLPLLRGLDLSRTDVILEAINLILTSPSIRVICALGCTTVERFHSRIKYPTQARLLLHRHADLKHCLLALALACCDRPPFFGSSFLDWSQRIASLSAVASSSELTPLQISNAGPSNQTGAPIQTQAGMPTQTQAGIPTQTQAGIPTQTQAGVPIHAQAGVPIQGQGGAAAADEPARGEHRNANVTANPRANADGNASANVNISASANVSADENASASTSTSTSTGTNTSMGQPPVQASLGWLPQIYTGALGGGALGAGSVGGGALGAGAPHTTTTYYTHSSTTGAFPLLGVPSSLSAILGSAGCGALLGPENSAFRHLVEELASIEGGQLASTATEEGQVASNATEGGQQQGLIPSSVSTASGRSHQHLRQQQCNGGAPFGYQGQGGHALELFHWTKAALVYSMQALVEESGEQRWDDFWVAQGTPALLLLMQSRQAMVRERAAATVGLFTMGEPTILEVDGGFGVLDRGHVNRSRASALLKGGGVRLLVRMAASLGAESEGCISEAARALWHLSAYHPAAEQMVKDGALSALVSLIASTNFSVVQSAAGALWNLSVGEGGKGSIAAAGGIHALIGVLERATESSALAHLQASAWQLRFAHDSFSLPAYPGEYGLERVIGALANLAADDKCSGIIVNAGGVPPLVTLLRYGPENTQVQAARSLANLAAHGDTTVNTRAVGQHHGCLHALVLLLPSANETLRQEAAGALWNLSFDESNRESIAACGGVAALVALARDCAGNRAQGIAPVSPAETQERAAGALWGLSVSEANSTAIGKAGGITPLLELAQSTHEEVRETATGALWNLAFNPCNAARIVEGGGVTRIANTCAYGRPHMARFMAALSLAYIFDGHRDAEMIAAATSSSFESELDNQRKPALAAIGIFLKGLTSFSPQSPAPENENEILVGMTAEEIEARSLEMEMNSDTPSTPDTNGVPALVGSSLWIGTPVVSASDESQRLISHMMTDEERAASAAYAAASDPTTPSGSGIAERPDTGMTGRPDRSIVGRPDRSIVKRPDINIAERPDTDVSERPDEAVSEARVAESERRSTRAKAARNSMRTSSSGGSRRKDQSRQTTRYLSALAHLWRIQEAGLLRCSSLEIKRFVSMLRGPSPTLRSCAAFALLQFTMPGGRNTAHHCSLLDELGARRAVRAAAAASKEEHLVKLLTKMILNNFHSNGL